MSLTLLVDLDDTLLLNSMEQFLPAYLNAISSHLAPALNPKDVLQGLMAGTREMVKNERPDRTLKEAFDSVFYPLLGIRESEYSPIFADFYARIYPQLRTLTRPNPEARSLLAQVRQRQYRLVIATNPLFPLTAIQQRAEWAGVSSNSHTVELIPSYETMHFAKPHPSYYAELLGILGWPEGAVVMVGDDLENDIYPARSLQLAAYWVHPEQASLDQNDPFAPSASGDLHHLLDWIDATGIDQQPPDFSTPGAALAVLRATPAALHTLCRQLSPELWNIRPQLTEWCQAEILCHLRDVEREVNLPRLQRVIQENNPFISGQDTDPWAEQRQYICQDGRKALADFTSARLAVLEMLSALDAEDWQRPARHTIFGPTDLKEIASIIAAHDRLHLRQVRESLITSQ